MKGKGYYGRVSSEEQARKETIEIQRVGVRRALESRNIKLDPDLIFEDNGVSGATKLESRPAGRALLQVAREGKLDELFVWNWNRLARNLQEFLNVLDELDRLGVKVTCINQPTEDTPSGKLMRQVMGAFAEFDHAQILENTRNGFTKKAVRGGYNGGFIPFGLRVEGQGKDARKVLDKRPLPGLKLSGPDVVVRMIRMAADQKKSGPEIARWLEALDVSPPKVSPRWTNSTVRHIIRNPIYQGIDRYRVRSWVGEPGNKRLKVNSDSQVIKGYRENLAIVSPELQQRAIDALHENAIPGMSHAKHLYLLRSKIKCDTCGHRYIGRGDYYVCIGRHCAKRWGRPPCPSPSLRRADLETAVRDDIERFAAGPGDVLTQLEEQMRVEGQSSNIAGEMKTWEDRLKVLDSAETIAFRQLTRGKIDERKFDKEMESICRDRQTAQGVLRELPQRSAEQDVTAVALEQAQSLLVELRDRVHGNMAPAQWRPIFERSVVSIRVSTVVAR